MTQHLDSRLEVRGLPGSAQAFSLRDYLSRSGVKYRWIRADSSAPDLDELPSVRLPDGTLILRATVSDLARALGWMRTPKLREYDLSIFGGGPAGLSAAVYAASEGLRVVVVERDAIGGQAGSSSLIENYLGFPAGIPGAQLAERAKQQAVDFGAELLIMREGMNGRFENGLMYANLADGTTMVSRSNLCATGVRWRRLGLQNEAELVGRDLFYGAGLSEAADCAGATVMVVGGGNAAGQAAMNLAAYAATVMMVVRGPSLAATLSSYLAARIRAQRNITVMLDSRVVDVQTGDQSSAVTLEDTSTRRRRQHPSDKIFVCIGGEPETEWAAENGIVRDELGYLVTGPDLPAEALRRTWKLNREPYYLETNIPGSFAAGDVRHKSVKRVASAVGEGAMVVAFVHRFLAEDI